MKEILKEHGGTLFYDESMNRLILNITDADKDTFNKLIDKAIQTIGQYHVNDFLLDASHRETTDVNDLDYAEQHIKRIVKKGLDRMAIVMNRDTFEADLATSFISNLASNSVRGFFDHEKALNWLDSDRSQQKIAG